jgi:tetratricopeptide (TPR) repeat protein
MNSNKKPGTMVLDRRTQQAVEAFEKALKVLHKRDYEKAAEQLDALIEGFPEERDVLERARAYRALCTRALAEAKKAAFKPKGFDEIVKYGVYLHNRGEFEEALKFLRQAEEIHPRNEHVLYCLAATASRAGDTSAALKALRTAIQASPANRALAKSDSDFDPIRDDDEFIDLVYAQAS